VLVLGLVTPHMPAFDFERCGGRTLRPQTTQEVFTGH
jgi:hypothetical protein